MTAPLRSAAGTPPTRRDAAHVGVLGLVALAVVSQVVWPLLTGEALRLLTLGSVVLFAAASLAHAVVSRGLAYAATVAVVAGGGGLLVEALGTASGFPFGAYAYADTLGPRLLGVPLVVPLAWVMMAHPCAVAGGRLGGASWGWLPGAWLLATWDVFLDPQMVGQGHWTWADPSPGLPGVGGIPLTNYAGWLVTAAVMMLVLVRRSGPPLPLRVDAPAVVLLLWTYASQVLGNLVFFDRPAVAAWGGLLMGLVAVPYAVVVGRDLRTSR